MPRRLRRNAPQPDPLRLGAELEVLEPSELRSKIAEMTGAVAARFAAAPEHRVARTAKAEISWSS